jgi:hypothetical protein
MQNQKQEDKQKMWSIEIGFYPGVLIGARSYNMEDHKVHVLYLPFIDVAFYTYG